MQLLNIQGVLILLIVLANAHAEVKRASAGVKPSNLF